MPLLPQTLLMLASSLISGTGDDESKPDRPPIDLRQPKKFQTATFAMG